MSVYYSDNVTAGIVINGSGCYVNGTPVSLEKTNRMFSGNVVVRGPSIVVGGRSVAAAGGNVSETRLVGAGRVFVGGVEVEGAAAADEVVIKLVPVEDEEGAGPSLDVRIEGDAGMVSTASGTVDVRGRVDGSAKTASGEITVEGGVGGNVRTVSGDVLIAKDVDGAVKTVSGDVRVRSVSRGPVVTVSGDITVLKGKISRASAVSGDVIRL